MAIKMSRETLSEGIRLYLQYCLQYQGEIGINEVNARWGCVDIIRFHSRIGCIEISEKVDHRTINLDKYASHH